jgi:hypothetical protein
MPSRPACSECRTTAAAASAMANGACCGSSVRPSRARFSALAKNSGRYSGTGTSGAAGLSVVMTARASENERSREATTAGKIATARAVTVSAETDRPRSAAKTSRSSRSRVWDSWSCAARY